MLAFDGNTAPYLQYACARIRSIFRRSGIPAAALAKTVVIGHPEERALALELVRFGEALSAVTHEAVPHLMCGYLYGLAGLYMRFYESCPVLREDVPPAVRDSRLTLCDVTVRTIETGLTLLGIETPERM
jgi:arginyl-tRNA synthetase